MEINDLGEYWQVIYRHDDGRLIISESDKSMGDAVAGAFQIQFNRFWEHQIKNSLTGKTGDENA